MTQLLYFKFGIMTQILYFKTGIMDTKPVMSSWKM